MILSPGTDTGPGAARRGWCSGGGGRPLGAANGRQVVEQLVLRRFGLRLGQRLRGGVEVATVGGAVTAALGSAASVVTAPRVQCTRALRWLAGGGPGGEQSDVDLRRVLRVPGEHLGGDHVEQHPVHRVREVSGVRASTTTGASTVVVQSRERRHRDSTSVRGSVFQVGLGDPTTAGAPGRHRRARAMICVVRCWSPPCATRPAITTWPSSRPSFGSPSREC